MMRLLLAFMAFTLTHAFVAIREGARSTALHEMKRPLLDQLLASTLFRLENARVQASSEVDDQGREGEPMQWSEKDSFANRFSEVMAVAGYGFKQWVADLVAGDFDEQAVTQEFDDFTAGNTVAMYSFSTCPFCRRAKDCLQERGIKYAAVELDQVDNGNEIRAVLGRKTRRTSVPAIFIRGNFIGGCNDGPGLLPLAESGEFDAMLKGASLSR